MTLAMFLLSMWFNTVPVQGYAPTIVYATVRFDRPVLGEVCFQAEAVSEDAEILFREACEGIDGSAKQIRWHWPYVGEWRIRAVYRGGTEKVVSPYRNLRVIKTGGR